ncbi:MAG: ATP-binding protein, partial [Pseudomonadota bacterium]
MTRHDAVTLDAAQWMEAALHLLALHLRHEVAITRAFRGDERRDAFLGLLMSDEEAERVIDEMTGRLQLEGGHLDERAIDKAWAELITERHRDPEGIWSRMADVFELSAIELDLLVLAAAPAIDPRFGRVFGYLNDDMARRHLTPALVQRLLPVRIDALTVRRLLSERAPLIAYGLIDAENARPAIERALRVDEALLDLLLGAAPEVEGTLVHLGDGVRPERSVIVAATSRGDASATVLDLAEAHEWPLAILPPTSVPQRLRSGVRDAHLAGHIPVVSGADELSDEQLRSLQLVFQSGILLVTIAPAKWISAGIDAEPITARPVPDARRRHWLDRLNTGGALVNARHVDLLEIARLGSAATSADTLEQIVSAEAGTGLGS